MSLRNYLKQKENQLAGMNWKVCAFYDTSDCTFMRTCQLFISMFECISSKKDKFMLPFNIDSLESFGKNVDKNYKYVVIYVGHGVNGGNSKWPEIKIDQFSYISLDKYLFDLSIDDILLIYDCCNSLPERKIRFQKMSFPGVVALFSFKGKQIINSFRKGSKSWYFDANYTLFFVAFETTYSSEYTDLKDSIIDLNENLKRVYKQNNLNINYNNKEFVIDCTLLEEDIIMDNDFSSM